MWGQFELLQFYCRYWASGMMNSAHHILNHTGNWQYWLWFTFVFLINLYFVFIFRILDYRRADIRGRRSTGDKRRSAWPEIFTCFFPFVWCVNILHLSLYILQTIETSGGYVSLTVHIVGFQWGWKYGYDESDDDIIQELILSMYELIEISKIQEGFGGVLSTFTRFKTRSS